MTDLAYLSAVTAVGLFASGELSPVELVTAVVERAEKTEPVVNAMSDRYFEDALRQARVAEERYRSGAARPLEGVPVALKEEHPVAGLPCREGSLLLRDTIAGQTHPIVERITAAGGIVHARTTTPEFCCAGFTHSDLWGITRNPWNPEYSAGGSSGGSGAVLAAGSATLATGSDIGGSIRIPASCNGVVGFKPPYGRVPALPPANLDHYCHDGPMARTVADCALLQNVIAGQHPLDAVSLPAPPPIPLTPSDVRGRRVALCVNLGDYPVEPDVVTATLAAAEALREAGVTVAEIELPWTRAEIMSAAWAHYRAVFAPMIEAVPGERTRYTQDFLARANAAGDYYQALLTEAKIHADLADVFGGSDALLCPTSGIPAFPAGADYVDTPLVVAGVRLEHHLEAPLTIPFNMAGRCPVLSVPSGLAANGIPTGVQIVGRPYDDHTVFALGHAVQSAIPPAHPS